MCAECVDNHVQQERQRQPVEFKTGIKKDENKQVKETHQHFSISTAVRLHRIVVCIAI